MKRIFVLGMGMFISGAVMAQHVLVLKSGEKMNGTVESLNNGVMNFKFKGNSMKFNVNEISSVVFDDKDDGAVSKTITSGSSSTARVTPKEPGEKTVTSGSYTVRYKCANRVITKPPQVSNLTEEKGTVMVEITIDKYGHVMRAIPGGEGTTTSSDYLRKMAMKAAQSALFDNVPTAPLETKGYMIFTY